MFSILLQINIDGFKKINDSRGYEYGDKVLCHVASFLFSSVKERDTVCRASGDEFFILLSGIGKTSTISASRSIKIANRINYGLTKQPIYVDGKSISLGLSMGLTLIDNTSVNAEDLISQTSLAVQQAKSHRNNNIIFYRSEIQDLTLDRLNLEVDLYSAVNTDQLEMFIQPQYSEANKVSGAELLMRWKHPEKGFISPDVFIPIAEELKLIKDLTDWSIRVACETLIRLQKAGELYPVAVNISPKRLEDPAFIDVVKSIISSTDAPADLLIFEVTENIWVQDQDTALCMMQQLCNLGIRFSLDDFGTGYSNLASLSKLPLYEIKIDKSLIKGIPEDKNNMTIVELTLILAQKLGFKTVAEGVETDVQLHAIKSLSCDSVQGYFYSRPMPLNDWFESS